MGEIQPFPYSGSKAARQKYTEQKAWMDFEASILSQTQTPLQRLKGGSGFETSMYRCTSGELKMKFIAQNYAVLMGFEGCALMRPNGSKINGLTIQFAESAAF